MNYRISFSEMNKLAQTISSKQPKASLEDMRKQVAPIMVHPLRQTTLSAKVLNKIVYKWLRVALPRRPTPYNHYYSVFGCLLSYLPNNSI